MENKYTKPSDERKKYAEILQSQINSNCYSPFQCFQSFFFFWCDKGNPCVKQKRHFPLGEEHFKG